MAVSEHTEGESFIAFLPSLSADPQRFFQTESALIEFAGYEGDKGSDEEARCQDGLITDLLGECLRLMRELQGLLELVGKEEAMTDLVQSLRLCVPILVLSSHL